MVQPCSCLKKVITADNFRSLLEHTLTIHRLGYVHRDLRLENFILVDNGERAVLNGFDCLAKIGVEEEYTGTYETASQMILSKLSTGTLNIRCFPQDDLESLYKSYLTWSKNLYMQLKNIQSYSGYFDFWNLRLDQLFYRFPLTPEEWVDALNEQLCYDLQPISFWKELEWDKASDARKAGQLRLLIPMNMEKSDEKNLINFNEVYRNSILPLAPEFGHEEDLIVIEHQNGCGDPCMNPNIPSKACCDCEDNCILSCAYRIISRPCASSCKDICQNQTTESNYLKH